MELKEAIREIKLWIDELKEAIFLDFYDKRYLRAIDTVLAELDRKDEEIKNYQNTIEVIEELSEITKNKLTLSEYIEIHSKECSKYDECKPECRFWGLCENKTIPICNINSAIYTAEKIKEGVYDKCQVQI